LQQELSLADDHRWIKVLNDIISRRPWMQTNDQDIMDVMGSVPECAANGCQFRKTLGYAPEQHPDFPRQLTMFMTEERFMKGVLEVAGDIGESNAGAKLRDLMAQRLSAKDCQ
jgi:hypothetical protein